MAAFGRKVQNQFSHLSKLDLIKELVEVLAPKVQQLVTNLDCIAVFHPTDLLNNPTLSLALNKAIINHLPSPFGCSSTPRWMSSAPSTWTMPSIQLYFISCPPSSSTWRKPARICHLFPQESVNYENFKHCDTSSKPMSWNQPPKPCSLCPYKGFEEQHFTFSEKCIVKKLSSPEILQFMDTSRSCPICGC